MAKAHATWTVWPHRPIEKLSDRLWRVEGDLAGVPMKRVMTIARREGGDLVVHNGIAVGDAELAEITGWGRVRVIVVPNGYHRLDARVFHERFPEARVVCPAGARTKVEEVVPVSGSYEDVPADPAVELQTLAGTRQREGVMIVRGSDGTSIVVNDVIFNMPHVRGFTGFVLRRITGSTGGPRISRLARLAIVSDRAALRAHLERLAGLPDLRRIVVSHHEVIDQEPASVLRAIGDRFL